MKYEVCTEEDTDLFLPVQGQRRSNISSNNSLASSFKINGIKNKRASKQCLQQ